MTSEPTPRETALKAAGLSPAAWDALDKFSQPGGHGFGEYAYLRRPTAKALARRGLVELGRRPLFGGRSCSWGTVTEAGRQLLNKVKADTEAESARQYETFRARLAALLAAEAAYKAVAP